MSLHLILLFLMVSSLHAQTTASECTLVALLAARARIMEGRPLSDTSRLVCYFSDQVIFKRCRHTVPSMSQIPPACLSGASMSPAARLCSSSFCCLPDPSRRLSRAVL